VTLNTPLSWVAYHACASRSSRPYQFHINMHTEFETPSFTLFKDSIRAPKMDHVTVTAPALRVVCHLPGRLALAMISRTGGYLEVAVVAMLSASACDVRGISTRTVAFLAYKRDIPLLSGFIFFLCSLTRCLALAPLKLRPYGAIQICLLLLLLLLLYRSRLTNSNLSWCPG